MLILQVFFFLFGLSFSEVVILYMFLMQWFGNTSLIQKWVKCSSLRMYLLLTASFNLLCCCLPAWITRCTGMQALEITQCGVRWPAVSDKVIVQTCLPLVLFMFRAYALIHNTLCLAFLLRQGFSVLKGSSLRDVHTTAGFVLCVSVLQWLAWLLSSRVCSAVLWHYCHSRRIWTIVTTVSHVFAPVIANIWRDSVADIEQGELDHVISMCSPPPGPRCLRGRNCWPAARWLAYISEGV